ncbi:MAG TPA: polyprenyl diphosphate synthase [Candidatus Saccharibacteria bacterium]|nr:polyprenyl diphosphate synthase [Candidatus Saccharibacteria bacterium]
MTEEHAVEIKHLGLILDGNRRWAKANGLPIFQGHARGYENLKTIIKEAVDQGIKYISAYAFSTENWERSEKEVSYLMKLALKIATKDVAQLHGDNIKVIFVGSRDRLSSKLVLAIEKAEELTKNNTVATVGLCFNYGGQNEIIDAVNKYHDQKDGKRLSKEDFEQLLYSRDFPNLDMIIRTSGEKRLSGFMLYKAAYAELFFNDKFWPDFDKNDLNDAINDYKRRIRRFGK